VMTVWFSTGQLAFFVVETCSYFVENCWNLFVFCWKLLKLV
jgi:hypothetical protein